MARARDVMTPRVECLKTTETVFDAAQRLAKSDIGAVPVFQPDGRLAGVVTDRDIVVKCIAEGRDPKGVLLEQLADQPEVVTIGADDSIEEAMSTMKEYKVRHLPVIDGQELVGFISQADLARHLSSEQASTFLAAISA